ncbi:MAG: hypothetical protein L3K13_06745, partial [Thermoplasmata archaeon]|nr:hypothetical protein [Thermoplasmata archaeon]
RARELRKESNADWVVANAPSNLASAEGSWWVLPPRGRPVRLAGSKREAAGKLLDLVGRGGFDRPLHPISPALDRSIERA